MPRNSNLKLKKKFLEKNGIVEAKQTSMLSSLNGWIINIQTFEKWKFYFKHFTSKFQATADPESIQLNGDIALDFLDQKQKNTKPREGALLFLEKDGMWMSKVLIENWL